MLMILGYINIILTGAFIAWSAIGIVGLCVLAKEGYPAKDGFFRELLMNLMLSVVFILNLIYLF